MELITFFYKHIKNICRYQHSLGKRKAFNSSKRLEIKKSSMFSYHTKQQIVELGRALWRSPCVTPLLKAGSTRAGCTVPCPCGFWGWSPQIHWISCASIWPSSQWVFSDAKVEFPVFLFVSITSLPVTSYHWQKSCCFLYSLLLSKLNNHSSISLSSYATFSNPFCIFCWPLIGLIWSMCFLHWVDQTRTHHFKCALIMAE